MACEPSGSGVMVVTGTSSLLCSGGQHFVHVAKGNGRGDAPGQQLDHIS